MGSRNFIGGVLTSVLSLALFGAGNACSEQTPAQMAGEHSSSVRASPTAQDNAAVASTDPPDAAPKADARAPSGPAPASIAGAAAEPPRAPEPSAPQAPEPSVPAKPEQSP